MPFLKLEDHFPYFHEHPKARKRFVGLACCGKKKWKEKCEAQSLYRAPYSKTGIEWIKRNCEDWRILSAKHFVLKPDQVIEPYDLCLEDFSAEDRRKWGKNVSRHLNGEFPGRKFICVNSTYGELLDLDDLTLVFDAFTNYGNQLQTNWLKANLVLDDVVLEKIRQGET